MSDRKKTLTPELVDGVPAKKGRAHSDDMEEIVDVDSDSAENLNEEESEFLPILSGENEELLPASLSQDLTIPSGLDDPLKVYLKQIAKYPLLSVEQEKALTQALAETGDVEIAKKLVVSNLRLVVKIAMEYRSAYANVLDLIQEGNIGLMKAVSKYDSSKGAKLSYYASWWIRSYILKFILDNFRLVKMSSSNEQKKLFYNLMKEKNRLLSMGVNPDAKTLSENLGVSEKAVVLMDQRIGSGGGEFSLDRPLGVEGSGLSYADVLSDSEQDALDQQLADLQDLEILKENLHGFVQGLKPRDRDIFSKRLLSEVPPSLQQIADEYGVSRERIRQIEERLMNNLKVYMSEFIR